MINNSLPKLELLTNGEAVLSYAFRESLGCSETDGTNTLKFVILIGMVEMRRVCLFPVGEYQFSGATAQVSLRVFVLCVRASFYCRQLSWEN